MRRIALGAFLFAIQRLNAHQAVPGNSGAGRPLGDARLPIASLRARGTHQPGFRARVHANEMQRCLDVFSPCPFSSRSHLVEEFAQAAQGPPRARAGASRGGAERRFGACGVEPRLPAADKARGSDAFESLTQPWTGRRLDRWPCDGAELIVIQERICDPQKWRRMKPVGTRVSTDSLPM